MAIAATISKEILLTAGDVRMESKKKSNARGDKENVQKGSIPGLQHVSSLHLPGV